MSIVPRLMSSNVITTYIQSNRVALKTEIVEPQMQKFGQHYTKGA
jgi:hypothetical protein